MFLFIVEYHGYFLLDYVHGPVISVLLCVVPCHSHSGDIHFLYGSHTSAVDGEIFST